MTRPMLEAACPECDGDGCFWNNNDPTSGQRVDCDNCGGTGLVDEEVPEDEAND